MKTTHIGTRATQCTGKRVYEQRSDCADVIRRAPDIGKGSLEAYMCPHCCFWHVGHSVKRHEAKIVDILVRRMLRDGVEQ